MNKLAKYLKPYIWHIFAVLILVIIQVNCDLALPDFMSKIVDQGIRNGDMSIILHMGLNMLGVALLGTICVLIVGFLASRIGTAAATTLRDDVFAKTESFSFGEFDEFSTASLITRTTNDIQQMQMMTVMSLRWIISAPIMAFGGVVRALQKSPSMSWIIAVAVVVLIGMIMVIFSIATPRFKRIQKLVDKLNLVTREGLTGVMVIRAFSNQKMQEERFDNVNAELTKVNIFVNRLMSTFFPAMMLIMNGATIAIIWIGAQYINMGSMEVGNMMAFMQYAMQIMMSFMMLLMMIIMVPRSSVAANRIAEVLAKEPSVQDAPNPKHFGEKIYGVIEFKDVSFCYPGADEPVLKNISFVANPSQTTAFIGSTGSGKSTIVNLIPRFYNVTSGQILIDGIDISLVNQQELRKNIGYVPQKGVLFSGSIGSNLRYAKEDATDEEIMCAARTAQAYSFIEEKEDGIETEIAQGGNNVSGGQRQRLSIARALTKKPQIYIFDDSFSALDFKTDAALRAALKRETGDATVLIVAQRVNTIMNAEQIIVLNNGEVVGSGTHKELLKTCEVYKQIALSQLSEEELA